jgi:hypothetical protein
MKKVLLRSGPTSRFEIIRRITIFIDRCCEFHEWRFMYMSTQQNCHTVINDEVKQLFAGLVVDLQEYTSMRY